MGREPKKPVTKVLLAVGGTGGHLFPAQALARDLQSARPIELLFAGAGLSTNRYFQREQFSYVEIESGTPRKGIGACVHIARGAWQSRELLKDFLPDLVVGFGSFHSFPLLLVARWMGIAYLLFTPDSMPGRVNRFFSKKALFTAIQFKQTAAHLKGQVATVQMPCWCVGSEVTREEARSFYGLEPETFTLLIFGGSQGAEVINRAASQLVLKRPFQVIHLAGEEPEKLRILYAKRGIVAHVAQFEEKMGRAYLAADLAICRAGAATLGELLAFTLPALLIPWPGAAESHQEINARLFAEQIGGGRWMAQEQLSAETLGRCIEEIDCEQMKQNLADYKIKEQPSSLAQLILRLCN